MSSAFTSYGTEEGPRPADIEDLARQLENLRGMLLPILLPKGAPCSSPRGSAGYDLQAQAYKTCAASLKAAASALRTFRAQMDI